ncbi:MAG: hypothetical protein J1F29_05700 [Lentimicrobiaceae bacterium]|nr:hypothetical protein [Lentimicrobiaceae bacterium]
MEDVAAIELLQDNDLEGFKEYLAADDTLDFGEPEYFDSEAEALAFCAGIGYRADERAPIERYPFVPANLWMFRLSRQSRGAERGKQAILVFLLDKGY